MTDTSTTLTLDNPLPAGASISPAMPPVRPGTATLVALPAGGFLLVLDKAPIGAAMNPAALGTLTASWARGELG